MGKHPGSRGGAYTQRVVRIGDLEAKYSQPKVNTSVLRPYLPRAPTAMKERPQKADRA